MKNPILLSFALASLVLSTGCTTGTQVMAMSGGVYTVTRSGQSGFTSVGALRKQAYDEANQFAASKGKIAEVISVNETPTGFARFPQVDLRFRLITAEEQAALAKTPNLAVQGQASHDAMGRTTDAGLTVNAKPDAYAELLKLDELRKKGIITDQEFEAQKKRVLEK